MNSNSEFCICDRKSDKNILLIGSCRITSFVNYFANDNYFDSYNILAIMVHNTEMINISKTLIDNETLKQEIYKTTIFVHEFCINFDYLNTSRNTEKNIFQIKYTFDIDISLPNYQDPSIYTKDIILKKNANDFHKYINKEILLEEFSKILKDTQIIEMKRYYNIINKSDLPELFDFLVENIYTSRIAHTINHPSNILFIKMYEIILKKFFNREIPQSVLENNNNEFLISTGYSTKLTFYDKECLDFNINEEYLNEEESNKYILEFLSK
jgi:hypothetical protein